MRRPVWLLLLCTFATGMAVIYLDLPGKAARVAAATWHLYGIWPFISLALFALVIVEAGRDGGRG